MRTRILLLVAAIFAALLPSLPASAADGEIVTIGRLRDYGWATKTAISADGNPMIATYRQTASHPIDLRTCLNPECTKARTARISSGAPYPTFDFAIGADGFPVFVVSAWNLFVGGGTVEVITCSDIHCRFDKTSELIWRSNTWRPSTGAIVVGPDNNPTVSFNVIQSAFGEGRRVTTLVSCRDAGCASDDRQSLGTLRGHDLAIGTNGFPMIARSGPGAGDTSKLERCLDSRCNSTATQGFGEPGSWVNAIAALDGEVTIITVDNNMRAQRVRCNASRCSSSDIISDNGVRATAPSVAYAEPGHTVVSYTDNAALDLWMHRCANTCESELLVDGNAGGSYYSGEVAAFKELAYISFHETSGRHLAMATMPAL